MITDHGLTGAQERRIRLIVREELMTRMAYGRWLDEVILALARGDQDALKELTARMPPEPVSPGPEDVG